jgi:DNA polymerase-3 subunit beta
VKLTADSGALARAAAYTARHVAATAYHQPVLTGLRLTAADDVTLTATDLDVWATAGVNATVADSGDVVLPARVLADITGRLPAGTPVDLVSDGRETTLTCSGLVAVIPTLPTDNWPDDPVLPPVLGTVDAKAFAEAVTRAAVATRKDSPVRALSSIHLATGAGGLVLSATDKYRIARVHVPGWAPADGREPGDDGLVDAATLAGLASAATGSVTVHLYPGARTFALTWDGGRAITRLVDDKIPAYDKVLAAIRPDRHLTVARTELLDTLTRLATLLETGGDKLPIAHLDLTPDALTLRTPGTSGRGRGSDTIPVDYDGDPVHLAVNTAYLASAARTAPGDALRVGIVKRDAAVMTVPDSPGWTHFLALVTRPDLGGAA